MFEKQQAVQAPLHAVDALTPMPFSLCLLCAGAAAEAAAHPDCSDAASGSAGISESLQQVQVVSMVPS